MATSRKRRAWAGTRRSYRDRRAGPVTATVIGPALPARGSKNAPVESVEPRAAPPPAREQEGDRDDGDPHARSGKCRRKHEDDSGARDQRRGLAHAVRCGQPEAETTGEQVWSRAKKDHGAATSRSCSIRAGPIPGIASRSSTELNAPFFCR